MEGPNYVIQKAVVEGINNGRGGKGSIFVFASGNGAGSGDQCNFDGYTNSIFSVTVSAIDYKGLHPRYSEPCAANMIVAYSSGSGKHIVGILGAHYIYLLTMFTGHYGRWCRQVLVSPWRHFCCCSKCCGCLCSRFRSSVSLPSRVFSFNIDRGQ
jgi:hypothetical protein